MNGYKMMESDMTCKGFQYEIGFVKYWSGRNTTLFFLLRLSSILYIYL